MTDSSNRQLTRKPTRRLIGPCQSLYTVPACASFYRVNNEQIGNIGKILAPITLAPSRVFDGTISVYSIHYPISVCFPQISKMANATQTHPCSSGSHSIEYRVAANNTRSRCDPIANPLNSRAPEHASVELLRLAPLAASTENCPKQKAASMAVRFQMMVSPVSKVELLSRLPCSTLRVKQKPNELRCASFNY